MQALDSFCLLSSVAVSGEGEYVLDLLKLIGFLGLLGAGAYFLTDYTRRKRIRSALKNEGKIVVADTCSLGNKQFLVVAQYGAEKHLIGVSQSSINHLSQLSSDNDGFQQKLDKVESTDGEESNV
jgi:flagellar biogenesis protein FliO